MPKDKIRVYAAPYHFLGGTTGGKIIVYAGGKIIEIDANGNIREKKLTDR